MLYHAHSGLRYIVLLLGAAALLYALWGLATKRAYDRPMQILGMSFAGTLHLQVVLGFLVLFAVVGRDFHPGIMGHLFMMLMAAAAVQVPLSVMKRRAPEARSLLPIVIGVGVGLLFIVGGILSIGRSVFGTVG
jgi:hypothetical protein